VHLRTSCRSAPGRCGKKQSETLPHPEYHIPRLPPIWTDGRTIGSPPLTCPSVGVCFRRFFCSPPCPTANRRCIRIRLETHGSQPLLSPVSRRRCLLSDRALGYRRTLPSRYCRSKTISGQAWSFRFSLSSSFAGSYFSACSPSTRPVRLGGCWCQLPTTFRYDVIHPRVFDQR